MGFEEAVAPPQPPKREQIVLSMRGLVTLRGGIRRDDLPAFFARARALVEAWCLGVIVCDVEALTEPDLEALNGLARMQHFVRSHGKEMRLRSTGNELAHLLDFTGFQTCLPQCEPNAATAMDATATAATSQANRLG